MPDLNGKLNENGNLATDLFLLSTLATNEASMNRGETELDPRRTGARSDPRRMRMTWQRTTGKNRFVASIVKIATSMIRTGKGLPRFEMEHRMRRCRQQRLLTNQRTDYGVTHWNERSDFIHGMI